MLRRARGRVLGAALQLLLFTQPQQCIKSFVLIFEAYLLAIVNLLRNELHSFQPFHNSMLENLSHRFRPPLLHRFSRQILSIFLAGFSKFDF